MKDKEQENFYKDFRSTYSQYWIERWGLIPEIPTSFDNANSIYELLAWLQRAFKNLLDDFQALEGELDDYKNALIDLLETLIPTLIRRYMDSDEANNWFNTKANSFYNRIIKPYIDQQIRQVNNRIDELTNRVNNIDQRLSNAETKITNLTSQLGNTQNQLNQLQQTVNNLTNQNNELKTALTKIINNLQGSGAWSGGLTGNFNSNRNIATGNINLFGGAVDGGHFIRTNNGQSINDLAGGI